MIRAEGERIAATADTLDREKIQTQLQSLAERWTELLDKAGARYVSVTVQGRLVIRNHPTSILFQDGEGVILHEYIVII